MTSVKLQVLDVGQGQGNFLEIYDDAGKLIKTILMDLGAEDEAEAAGVPSVDFVAETLEKMDQPTINVLFISHGDRDHHELLWKLLAKFTEYDPRQAPNKKMLLIERTVFGGEKWAYTVDGSNILTRIERYMNGAVPQDLKYFKSSFRPPKGKEIRPFAAAGSARVYIIAGNCWAENASRVPDGRPTGVQKRKAKGYLLNTVSLVLLVRFTDLDIQFVTTGDATGVTMVACNQFVTDEISVVYMPEVLMVTAPHHGSASTAFNAKLFAKPTEPQQTVEEFVKKINARSVTASASTHRHGHPGWRLLDYFVPKLAADPYYKDPTLGDRHFYTGHFAPRAIKVPNETDPKQLENWPATSEGYYTVRTKANIYTTTYYSAGHNHDIAVPPAPAERLVAPAGAFPLGVTWTYTVDAGSNVTLVPKTNRARLAGPLLARLAVPPPAAPRPAAAPGTGPGGLRRLRVFP